MLLEAGWEAMLRHAALGTAWLLQYQPQSVKPDPAGALFASLVLLTAIGSLLVSNAPYACLYVLRARAPASSPSYFDRYLIQPPPLPAPASSTKATTSSTEFQSRLWEEYREALSTMAIQIVFLWAVLCYGGGSTAILHYRPEWRDALEGYIFRDGDKAAATAGMLSFPPWPRMLREVLVCLLLEDTLFYWTHRLFHHPWLYATFHKTHHRFKAPFSVGSTYASLVDFAIGASLPLTVALIFACGSLPSVMVCGSIRLFQTTETHSGYAFPWSVDGLLRRLFRSGTRDLFYVGSRHHDAHHERTHGNYALSFVFWDAICGTLLEPRSPEGASSDKGRANGDKKGQ